MARWRVDAMGVGSTFFLVQLLWLVLRVEGQSARGQDFFSKALLSLEVSPAEDNLCGTVCPACTGPLQGPNFPSEDRDLPYLASHPVRIAIVGQKCTKLGKSEGLQPEFSPFSSRTRAGQTLPL